MAKSLSERLQDLQLSATDVRLNNPKWTEEMVLDYVGKSEDLQRIAKEVEGYIVLPSAPTVSKSDIEDALRAVIGSSIQRKIEPDAPIPMQPRKVAAPQVYSGAVDLAGNSINLPSGWTSTRIVNPGEYRVTHNLGAGTTYSVVTSAVTGLDRLAVPVLIQTNSFTVRVFKTDTNASVNEDFNFIMKESN